MYYRNVLYQALQTGWLLYCMVTPVACDVSLSIWNNDGLLITLFKLKGFKLQNDTRGNSSSL
jgi:hypothetical protein